MKKVMYLLVLAFFAMSCDNSNLLEPSYNNSQNFEKSNSPIKDFTKKRLQSYKAYKNISFLSKYYFNPRDVEHNCGGYLDKKPVKYQYETATERYLRNLRIYCPSTLKVGNTVYKTFNVYTINRHELLSQKGSVLSGTTWGTLKVIQQKDINPKKKTWIDEVENLNEESLSQNPIHKKFGSVLFIGKFNGVMIKSKTKINLSGKGVNKFRGGKLTAQERMNCAGDFCWKSEITGSVRVVENREE